MCVCERILRLWETASERDTGREQQRVALYSFGSPAASLPHTPSDSRGVSRAVGLSACLCLGRAAAHASDQDHHALDVSLSHAMTAPCLALFDAPMGGIAHSGDYLG